ncbi:MAG: hypothetical protein R3D30_12385 [Hyphomicrobiales bacterium]
MTDGEGGTGTTETPAADDGTSLDEQLTALEEKKEAAQKAQIDANIADLTKLIVDAEKADEDYAKAYEQLRDDETRLKNERDGLSTALKAVLGESGIEAVKNNVAEAVKVVADAECALKTAKDALDDAQQEADEASKTLDDRRQTLDNWRKPADSIGKRLKSGQTLIDEIKKLRNNGRRAEAYWKLALGVSDPEDPMHVPGQSFLNIELSREPKVIRPDQLRAQIEAAWNAFTEARMTAATKALELDKKKAAHKAAETAFKDVTKNLIKAITDALAEPEAPADAA